MAMTETLLSLKGFVLARWHCCRGDSGMAQALSQGTFHPSTHLAVYTHTLHVCTLSGLRSGSLGTSQGVEEGCLGCAWDFQ